MKKLSNVNESYNNLLKEILEYGYEKNTRSGKVISLFDKNIKIDMKQGFPLLTTKKMFYKGCIHELLWFLKGDTNIKYLVENGVNIWNDDAYRYYVSISKFLSFINRISFDFRDNINLPISLQTISLYGKPIDKENFLKEVIEYEGEPFIAVNSIHFVLKGGEEIVYRHYDNISINDEIEKIKKASPKIESVNASFIRYRYGDLGEVYGAQWRNYGYEVDQISNIVKTLKENPDDRRIICDSWASNKLNNMALPPCHYSFQFYTRELTNEEREAIFKEKYPNVNGATKELIDDVKIPKRELSLKWIQRSCDFFLGVPFNICSYGLLLCMMAQCVNMSVGTLGGSFGDCHIYQAHIDAVEEQLSRDPLRYELPKLVLNKDIKNIFDFKYDDIKIADYKSYEKISAPL